MQGIILSLPVGPRSEKVNSYTTSITVGIGLTRIINFKAEFRGIARSIAFVNRDAANTALIIINNDRINTFTIAANSTFNFNDQWCEQVEITAGAAGVVNLFIELVPEKQLGLG